jgi:RND family efflux transporter MFP subunit
MQLLVAIGALISGRAIVVRRFIALLALAWVQAAMGQSELPTVVVEPVAEGPIRINLPLTGTVTAPRAASLSARLEGLVSELDVDVGDRVDKGERLLALDDTLARLALEQARAVTAEAEVNLEEQRRLLAEGESLFAKRSIPETRLRALQAQARLAQATLARRQAEEREQRERVERHRLTAPFAGVIAERSTDLGEWLATGSPAFELVATRPLLVDVRVPQDYYALVDEGVEASVSADNGPGDALPGRVATRVPVKDTSTRTFLVRVALDQEPAPLTPGMAASVRLILDTDESGLKVPADAVLRHADGQTVVWIAEQRGETRVARRRVTLGRVLGEAYEVLGGLEAGELVVVLGNERLRDDQRVLAE